MNVVHLSDSLNQAMGGPPRSIVGLCEHLAPLVDRLDLCGVDLGPHFGGRVDVDESRLHLTEVPSLAIRPLRLYIPWGLKTVLKDRTDGADIFHSHGLWAPANVICALTARKARIPLIISPRGSFEPAALAKSAAKKAICKLLYMNRALRQAACLHALTEREADCIREFGLTNPIAILPNAIARPPQPWQNRTTRFGEKKLIVFLGRIHPVKGLDILVEAWRRIAEEFTDWSLVLAGPDEDGYLAAIESQVQTANLADRVSLPGGLYGPDKDELLAAGDMFVLPSRREGMSVALLEAMNAGLPVVITKSCNFPAAESCGAGFVVDQDAKSLAAGLARMLKIPDDQRGQMGALGAALVANNYSWDSVAQEMLEVYRWVLGLRDAPSCVRMD
jgi:glycosyltransferase involved in cell wall biosynthesis